MKCSKAECGFVGPGNFCQLCGSPMVEDKNSEVIVICHGKINDVTVCGVELTKGKKFCTRCGTKVDPSLFKDRICECGHPYQPDESFCGECGTQIKEISTAPAAAHGNLPADQTSMRPETKETTNLGSSQTDPDVVNGNKINPPEQVHVEGTAKSPKENTSNPDSQLPAVTKDDAKPDSPKGKVNMFVENTNSSISDEQMETTNADEKLQHLKIIGETSLSNLSTVIEPSTSEEASSRPSDDTKTNDISAVKRNVKQKVGNEKKGKFEPNGNQSKVVNIDEKAVSNPPEDKNETEVNNDIQNSEMDEEATSTYTQTSTDLAEMIPGEKFVFGSAKVMPSTETNAQTQQSSSNLFTIDSSCNSNKTSLNITKENAQTSDAKNELINDGTDVDSGMFTDKKETRSGAKSQKKAKEKKNHENKQGSEPSPKIQQGRSKDGKEKMVTVRFHVLTSDEFGFDPTNSECILVIGNKECGGWKTHTRKMVIERYIEKHIYELIFEEKIPSRLIAGGSSIPYKYVFYKKQEELLECYMKNNKFENMNRDLKVPLETLGNY